MKKICALSVFAAGIFWGIIGVFSKNLALFGFSPICITAVRALFTAFLMALFLLIRDKKQFRISPRDIWMFLGTGLCSIVFFNICYFSTIESASVSVAAILLYTAPCFVMIMCAVLFREKLTAKKLICLAASFIGCVLVTGLGTNTALPVKSILTGIGSGIGYALYTVFSRLALKKYSPYTVTFYTFFVAALAIAPFSDIGRTAFIIEENPASLIFAFLIAAVSTLIPFLLYTKGLEGIEGGTASVIACVEPLVATLVGVLFYNDKFDVPKIIGIILIFASVLFVSTDKSDK